MSRNVARINNYYNRMSAWDDWMKIETCAMGAGLVDLVYKYCPELDAGYRKIDEASRNLRRAIGEREVQ